MLFVTPLAKSEIYPIDAKKNAQWHNNAGVEYMKERDYLAAIKEFKIAIALNPYKQTTAVYFNNLGTAYLEIAKIQKLYKVPVKNGNFAKYAEMSFKNAIEEDCMQLNFYKNLVESFLLQGTLNNELKTYKAKTSSNPFNNIIVALIYEKQGKIQNAQICLDEFISKYPDLLITISLKNYLNKL